LKYFQNFFRVLVGNLMFLGMQDFDFAQILITFAQISPEFVQILPKWLSTPTLCFYSDYRMILIQLMQK